MFHSPSPAEQEIIKCFPVHEVTVREGLETLAASLSTISLFYNNILAFN